MNRHTDKWNILESPKYIVTYIHTYIHTYGNKEGTPKNSGGKIYSIIVKA